VELRASDLDAYVAFADPELAVEERIARIARVREAVARGERDLADTRVAKDDGGRVRAAVRLVPGGPGMFTLAGPWLAEPGDDVAAASLVPEAMARARAGGARLVRCRPLAGRVGPRFLDALRGNGFRELGERAEFKTAVADLPGDEGTPLDWRDLDAVGLDRAAAALLETAAGDPHGDDGNDDPGKALAEWLGTPGLATGPGCVQVGFLDGRPAAFVCAQANTRTGWSRIAYMGVRPDLRGRGLGAWVHRRGFRIIREQGGTHYHGGTSTANAGMLALFRRHGCTETLRMHEFEWHA